MISVNYNYSLMSSINSPIMSEISFDTFDTHYNWIAIKSSNAHYAFIKQKLIEDVFKKLGQHDILLLTDYLCRLINFIFFRFHLDEESEGNFWRQLVQNNLTDLRALLNMILPFISDDSTDSKKGTLTSLSELYLKTDSNGKFVFTNMQYNRCIRTKERNGDIKVTYRPFLEEYFIDHFKLLIMSINQSANKMYVNWMDVIPIRMDQYANLPIYSQTVAKLQSKSVPLLMGYVDTMSGLSMNDIYNTITNHFYYQILNCKWLIFDVYEEGKLSSMLTLLEHRLKLQNLWDNKLWSQLTDIERMNFQTDWKRILDSHDNNDKVMVYYMYDFLSKNYSNANRLLRQNILIMMESDDSVDTDGENHDRIDKAKLSMANNYMRRLLTEDIYGFLFEQLALFRKSWYYYAIRIKKGSYPVRESQRKDRTTHGYDMTEITPKNFYNFFKSLIHFQKGESYLGFYRYWQGLPPTQLNTFVSRLLGLDETRWFNISLYIKYSYKINDQQKGFEINKIIEETVRSYLVDTIFESLIYHGLLTAYNPNADITDLSLIDKRVGTKDENKRVVEQRKQIKKLILSGTNKELYEKNAYYYLNANSYGSLDPIKEEEYSSLNCRTCKDYGKKYLDAIGEDMDWMFRYALNWVSQLNFFHHYVNNRVMYVTGATGVGKSTEVPKLLYYSTFMLDFKITGKVVCTIPRRGPVTASAEFVSKQMGVPILAYNPSSQSKIPTSNFYLQYKHQKGSHISTASASFLRFVTDGTLMEELFGSPFLSKSSVRSGIKDSDGNAVDWVKDYESKNTYDIVVVDEAHEHNTNMDVILTLMREAVYVNNGIKLVIISATMDDDEPIYRRYYRDINDNRAYPLSTFLPYNDLDRANMDRRVDISKPRETTNFKVTDYYAPKELSDKIDSKNYLKYGIEKTLEVLSNTQTGHVLLFMASVRDIDQAVKEINQRSSPFVLAMGYHGKLAEADRIKVEKISKFLPAYSESKNISGKVPAGTYKRAVIVATNAAEASLTIDGLKYVVDTGYANVNMYYPMKGTEELVILPISNTSSTQRRGRVGRRAAGDVHYLYAKDKVVNNKTSYKIADENISQLIVKMMKRSPQDHQLIIKQNDINDCSFLEKLINQTRKKQTGKVMSINMADVNKTINSNIYLYLNIILKQYCLVENAKIPSEVDNFYYYYGKGTKADEGLFGIFMTNSYMLTNHDDYFTSDRRITYRTHTGFEFSTLTDTQKSLDFYIIHPDENVIERNLFTGKMIGLKKNLGVAPEYYDYLKTYNDIRSDFQLKNYNYGTFALAKTHIFMDAEAARGNIVVNPHSYGPSQIPTLLLEKKGLRDQEGIFHYYAELQSKLPRITAEKTETCVRMETAVSELIGNTETFENRNNVVWYLHSISTGKNIDVIGIVNMINAKGSVSLFGLHKFPDIKRMMEIGQNNYGDIYYYWKIWSSLKKLLVQNDLIKFDMLSIKAEFDSIKRDYMSGTLLSKDKNDLLDRMTKTGLLHTKDELYYYVKNTEYTSVPESRTLNNIANTIASMYKIDGPSVLAFVPRVINEIKSVLKTVWCSEYALANHLSTDENKINFDPFMWLKTKLRLPKVFGSSERKQFSYGSVITNNMIEHTTTDDDWYDVLEPYLRAFSYNFVTNLGTHYLNISTDKVIMRKPWSKNLSFENTMLEHQSKYLIFHNEQTKGNDTNILFLTPITVVQMCRINPVYFGQFLYGSRRLEDPNSEEAAFYSKDYLDVRMDIKRAFSDDYLRTYVNSLDDKIIKKSLMNK